MIIYIYNKGLNDYTTPFQRLLNLLQDALDASKDKLADEHLSLGHKILVYLSCCLAGHQYPLGRIRDEFVNEVKTTVYDFLFSKKQKGSNVADKYCHVTTLLTFDTQELLNVLSLAFEEKEFELKQTEYRYTSKRQQVVDILLDVMLNGGKFTPAQVGCLYIFITRQMSKYGDSINISHSLFEEVLEYLTNPPEHKKHEERQQALLELQLSGGLDHCDEDRILQLGEEAKFYRLCEIFYHKDRQYYKVLSCYWRDTSRKHLVYGYIDGVISNDSCTDLEKEQLLSDLLKGMDELVEINSMKFARLIINY